MNAAIRAVKAEVVAVYGSLNALLGALVALGVLHLTGGQLGALVVIVNVVLGPVVHQLVVPNDAAAQQAASAATSARADTIADFRELAAAKQTEAATVPSAQAPPAPTS